MPGATPPGMIAFVQFEEQAHAETAMSLNGMMLGDRAIKIAMSANAIEKIPDEAEIHQTMAAVEKSKSVMEQIAGEIHVNVYVCVTRCIMYIYKLHFLPCTIHGFFMRCVTHLGQFKHTNAHTLTHARTHARTHEHERALTHSLTSRTHARWF